MAMRELQTADDVIDALGGTASTARLTGRKSQHVSNWRASGRLPADTFLSLRAALEKRGYTAPPALWRMQQPGEQ